MTLSTISSTEKKPGKSYTYTESLPMTIQDVKFAQEQRHSCPSTVIVNVNDDNGIDKGKQPSDSLCSETDQSRSQPEHRNNRNSCSTQCAEENKIDEDSWLQSITQQEIMTKSGSGRFVRGWRIVVIAVLVCSMIGTALAVYFYTSNQETTEFEQQFHNDAHKVLEALSKRVDLTFGAADTFVVSMVSTARLTNQQWPFVTIPNFAILAAKTMSLFPALLVNVNPLVTEEQRLEWQNYSATHNSWVDEGLAIQEEDDTFKGPIIKDYENYYVIHDWSEFSKDESVRAKIGTNRTGPYLPSWQTSPVIPRYPPFNFDLLAMHGEEFSQHVLSTQKVVVTPAYAIPDYNDPTQLAANEVYADYFRDFIDPNDDPVKPASDVLYPIFDKLDRVRERLPTDGADEKFVGFLTFSMYWDQMLADILPDGSNATVVVFNNPCNPSFTFKIYGPTVKYLGIGDLHESKFNNLRYSSSLANLHTFDVDDSRYTGAPLDADYCPFTISLYPSNEMEGHYISNNPIYFTIAAVIIFAFTSAVFLNYNYWVERRQKQVLHRAAQFSMNASMLEKMVEERTRVLQQTNQSLEDANMQIQQASALQLEHFACMSHEIRTPLNCVSGLSSVVKDDMRKLMETQDEELNVGSVKAVVSSTYESLQLIVSSGELLRTIVDDVLDFAKLGSGKVEINIQNNICLQEVLDSLVKSIECIELVQSKNISIKTVYGSSVSPYLTSDSRRLQQILYNLLGNAVKFSRKDGVIELKVYHPNIDSCFENNETSNAVLRFSVKDYGQGIAKDKFKAIFEPFVQANGAYTESTHGGTGLGLAITSRLVKALGGSIAVDSEEGCWTEFTVDFPLCNHLSQAQGESQDQIPNKDVASQGLTLESLTMRLTGKTVVLVDDNDDKRSQIENVFREYNISCIACEDIDAMESSIFNASQMNVLLVHEDLANSGQIDRWLSRSGVVDIEPKIIKFGPKHDMNDNCHGYFPELVRMIPAVMIKRIGDIVQIKSNEANITSPNTEQIDESYSKLRILIAEDNKVNQKVLIRILNRLKINNAVVVENGRDAAEREAVEIFDVVLMDMHMPILDGIDACKLIAKRELTEISPHPRAKVVFLTAHVSESFESKCYEAGAVGYLSKPVNIERIRECLKEIIAPRVS